VLNYHYLVATGLGVGKLPMMPGTLGSILGMLAFLLVQIDSFLIKMIILVVILIAGAYSSFKIEKETGREDNQIIVIDEIAGVWLTLSIIPEGVWFTLAGLLLFRLFDIWKPYPIRKLEKVKYGYGVMLDDILAGLYAGAMVLIFDEMV